MPPRQRVPEGPAPAPAVQRLRIRYAKRGRLRFTSTRDFQRVLERALRRAEVPVAFSAGFHPHPKISYANAAATGTASEAEYVEIHVTRRIDPDELRAQLDAALPDGLDVVAVVEPPPGPLADLLQASRWEIRLPGVEPAVADQAVAALLARDRVEVTRMTKNGPRTFDVREAVLSAAVVAGDATAGDRASDTGTRGELPDRPPGGAGYAILRLVVRHTTPAVRPDDVLTALRAVAGFEPVQPPRLIRLAQGPLDTGTGLVADPFTASCE